MKEWFTSMLSSNSKLSSKRFITFGAFILMGIAFLGNLFFDFTIEEFMFQTMSYIVIGGLGFTASEMFATKKTQNSTQVKIESNIQTKEEIVETEEE